MWERERKETHMGDMWRPPPNFRKIHRGWWTCGEHPENLGKFMRDRGGGVPDIRVPSTKLL